MVSTFLLSVYTFKLTPIKLSALLFNTRFTASSSLQVELIHASGASHAPYTSWITHEAEGELRFRLENIEKMNFEGSYFSQLTVEACKANMFLTPIKLSALLFNTRFTASSSLQVELIHASGASHAPSKRLIALVE
jgi:hypothetical protein